MENEKLFEFMEKIYSEMKNGFAEVAKEFTEVKKEITEIKNNAIVFENKVDVKLSALFDGQKQTNDKLDRIEKEVTRHDEFIMKRIK